jgi:acyl dehydratase
MKYFEDFRVGEVSLLGPLVVDEAEVLDYGRKYDPQPFHTDKAAAARTHFGGLIASGWHACAMQMRLMVEEMTRDQVAGMGSPGLESCRWLKPVRPGDRLTCRTEVIEVRPSATKPYGILKRLFELSNQDGEVVMRLIGLGLVAKRPEGGA